MENSACPTPLRITLTSVRARARTLTILQKFSTLHKQLLFWILDTTLFLLFIFFWNHLVSLLIWCLFFSKTIVKYDFKYTQYGPKGSLGNASVELQYSKPLFFVKFSVLVTFNFTKYFLLFKKKISQGSGPGGPTCQMGSSLTGPAPPPPIHV